jgi:hypothetical protein
MKWRLKKNDGVVLRHRQKSTDYGPDLRNRNAEESVPFPVFSGTCLEEPSNSLRALW